VGGYSAISLGVARPRPADYRQLDLLHAAGRLSEGPPLTLLNVLGAAPGTPAHSLGRVLLRLCNVSDCLLWTRPQGSKGLPEEPATSTQRRIP